LCWWKSTLLPKLNQILITNDDESLHRTPVFLLQNNKLEVPKLKEVVTEKEQQMVDTSSGNGSQMPKV
jgi:hypothetical protein